MKKLFLITFLITCFSCLGQNNPDRFPDGIGTKLIDPLGNTTAEINAFTNNALGRLAFNTDEGKWKRWDGSAWVDAFSGGSSPEFYTVTGTGANANVQIGSGDYNALIDLDFPTNTITLEYNTLILDNGVTVNGGDVIINDINNNEVGLEIRGSSTAISRSTNIGFSAFDNNSLSSVSLFNDGVENYVGIGKNLVNNLKIKSLIDDGTVGAPKDITVFFPNLTANDTIVVQSKLDAAISGVDSSIAGITQTGTIGSGDYLLEMGDVSAKIVLDEANGETTINGLTTIEGQTNINEDLYVSGDIEASRIVNLLAPSSDSDAANKLYVDNAIAGVGSGGHTIQNNGTLLTSRPNLNFVNGLLAEDNAGNTSTDVSIDGSKVLTVHDQSYIIPTYWGGTTAQHDAIFGAGFNHPEGSLVYKSDAPVPTFVAADITDFDTEVSNNTDVAANTSKVSFPEAPIDGNQYARIDGTWSIVSGGGGGSSLSWEGNWISQNYTTDQAVLYNGSSYVCILNTVSNELPTNTTYWQLLAQKGTNGVDGVVDGITLDVQSKKALEYLKGYNSLNYFNKNDLQDGYIANNTTQTITPPATDEKVSGKIYLSAGDYALYNISSAIYGYIQKFEVDGTYISTEQYFGTDINVPFNMPNDGYIIMDVNRQVTTSIDDIILSTYNPLFHTNANELVYGNYEAYAPYFDDIPKVELEATDNLINIDKILPYTGSESSYTDAYLRVDVSGGETVSLYNLYNFYSTTRKIIVEFDSGGTEIASHIPNVLGETYKQYTLNPSTAYFYLLFWDLDHNATWGGSHSNPTKIQDNIRLNLGEHFTQETRPFRIKSIDGVAYNNKVNPLKGKVIASFGDSTMSASHPSSSPGSFMDEFWQLKEAVVYNYGVGGAGLTDWSDTVLVTDGNYTQLSHENVVSNQIEQMIAEARTPEVVIIQGGTNDAFRSRVSGDLGTTITDYQTGIGSLNKEEIYGMLFWAVKRINDYDSNIKIYFALPFKGNEYQNPIDGSAGHNARLQPIIDNFRTVADALGIEIIDLNTNWLNSVDDSLPSLDFKDPLHPSDLAERKTFKKILPIIETYFKNN